MRKTAKSTPGKKRLNAGQRRVLDILACIPRGATEGLLLAHGFRRETLAGLALAGLATVTTETVRAGHRTIKVERFRITYDGLKAVEG